MSKKKLTLKQHKFAGKYIITGNVYQSDVQKFIKRVKNKIMAKAPCHTNVI